MKQFITLLAILAFTGLSQTANAQDTIASGVCGANLTWVLTEDSTLTISGSGAMYDYSYYNKPPWYFYQHDIDTIIIGDSVTNIGEYAFDGCVGIIFVTIGNSVTTIGVCAFRSCVNLSSVIIPDSVITIGGSAFNGCYSLTSVIIGSSVTSIGIATFDGCTSLIFVTIPNSVITIGNRAFRNCRSLIFLTIPNSVTIIGNEVFANCFGLTSITIPNSVTIIGGYAFNMCTSLTSVTIGNSVATIGSYAFRNCYFLSSLTLPSTLTLIGSEAFYNCVNLNSITCLAATPPIIDTTTFNYVPKNIPVYVPCNSFNAYKAANYWKNFTNFIGIPDTTITRYSAVICQGNAYSDNHFANLTQAGTYYDTLPNIDGCDSIIELTLTVNPVHTVPIVATICEGSVYNDDNFKNLTKSGTYYDTLQNTNSCDSIIKLTLTVTPVPIVPIIATICEGTTYPFAGKELTNTGIYYDTLQNENNCDSIICLTLTVFPIPPVTQIFDSIHQGDTCNFNGKLLTQEGTYYDTLQTVFGCDSIIELTLTISNLEIKQFTIHNSQFTIYPNPTTGQFTIYNSQFTIEKVEIFDIYGKDVLYLPSLLSPEPTIDLSHLHNGVYFIKLNNIIYKLIKK